MAPGVFILPFIFSALAGQLADKFEKAVESEDQTGGGIFMCLAAYFFISESLLDFGVLFLMGLQSTFLVPLSTFVTGTFATDELIACNGLIELGTFLSILMGTLVGGL